MTLEVPQATPRGTGFPGLGGCIVPKQDRHGDGRGLVFTALVSGKCFEQNPYVDFGGLSLPPGPLEDSELNLPCAFSSLRFPQDSIS